MFLCFCTQQCFIHTEYSHSGWKKFYYTKKGNVQYNSIDDCLGAVFFFCCLNLYICMLLVFCSQVFYGKKVRFPNLIKPKCIKNTHTHTRAHTRTRWQALWLQVWLTIKLDLDDKHLKAMNNLRRYISRVELLSTRHHRACQLNAVNTAASESIQMPSLTAHFTEL